MLTRFITNVTAKFNPFSAKARTARLFISFLPPNVRTDGMIITTKLLPRNSTEPSSLYVKFSKSPPFERDTAVSGVASSMLILAVAEDGKEMNLDVENMGIKGVVEEVDRHSRTLQKQADLNE